MWFTAIRRSYRAAPISKKIAQQKWTPFRLTEGEKEKEEERWPVYMAHTQAFIPFLFILWNKRGHRAFAPPPFNLAFEENNSATTKLDHVGKQKEIRSRIAPSRCR